MADIASLADEAFVPPKHGPKCFRTRLTGDADTLMSALEKRMADGDRPSYVTASRLFDEIGHPITSVSLRHHLAGFCSCHKR